MKRSTLLSLFAFVLLLTTVADGQLIVSHRGASHDAPENTLAAFNLAWEQNTDGIEGDFYLTKDKKIVCIHDTNAKRTAGADLDIERSTLSQLRGLDAGSWKDPKWAGERIPTFEEVFRTVPADGLFVIELKTKSAIVPVLAAELGRLDTSGIRILIITFDADTANACKKHLPDVRVHWLTGFKRSTPVSGYRPSAAQVAKVVRECGADGVGMQGNRKVIDAEFVAQLTAAGCHEYHVWTIDSPQDARYFQGLGVFGITTNQPREIRAAIGLVPVP